MAEFTITMHRAAKITDQQRRQRLHRAYSILLQAAREREAVKDEQQGSDADDE